jgi:hypothetical protein
MKVTFVEMIGTSFGKGPDTLYIAEAEYWLYDLWKNHKWWTILLCIMLVMPVLMLYGKYKQVAVNKAPKGQYEEFDKYKFAPFIIEQRVC